MLENAPHLTRVLEFLVPSYHWIDVAYLDIGLKIFTTGSREPGRISPSKFLSLEETLKRMPGLNQKGLVGGVVYTDGQFDDARYKHDVWFNPSPRLAENALDNHARVTDFRRDATRKLSGVVVKDQLSGQTFTVDAKVIVNAAGPVSGLGSPNGDSLRWASACARARRAHPFPAGCFPNARRPADSENRGRPASCLRFHGMEDCWLEPRTKRCRPMPNCS